MASRTITVDLKGGRALAKHLRNIEDRLGRGSLVNVGFLQDATYPVNIEDGKEGNAGLSVATVAFWNEFGTTRAPPRPFIRRMIASKSPRWGNALALNLKATDYDAQVALMRMGEGIKDQMVQSIVNLTEPALAPATIERKGFDKPLIDTGVMQRAVDYQVLSGEDAF